MSSCTRSYNVASGSVGWIALQQLLLPDPRRFWRARCLCPATTRVSFQSTTASRSRAGSPATRSSSRGTGTDQCRSMMGPPLAQRAAATRRSGCVGIRVPRRHTGRTHECPADSNHPACNVPRTDGWAAQRESCRATRSACFCRNERKKSKIRTHFELYRSYKMTRSNEMDVITCKIV
jgi:hypothetical protein